MMKVLHPTKLVAAATLAFSVLASPLAHASKDVTFAVAIALETLDPYNTNSTLNQAAGKAYYEGLFEFDKDLKIQICWRPATKSARTAWSTRSSCVTASSSMTAPTSMPTPSRPISTVSPIRKTACRAIRSSTAWPRPKWSIRIPCASR
ncbi:binding-protein-dependent transport periplasmic protein [Bordetella pertussis]|nr:binding-protein-dependent transport periplasmic protein [Bordetella pertussis]